MPPRDQLTKREHEAALLAIRGLTREEIAAELSVTLDTVKTHLARIYSKLGARNRLEMEHRLIRRGGGIGSADKEKAP